MIAKTYSLAVQFLAGLIALVGSFYLCQWFFGDLAQAGLVTITMKTNTALCFFLLGMGILLQMTWPQRRVIIGLVRGMASTVLAVGVLTFLENILGWDFRIDEFLLKEPLGALGVLEPNRMGIPASLSFTLAGIGLLCLTSSRRRAFAIQLLGSAICLIGLLAALGYLFNAESMFGLARWTAIALPTAVTLILLGVALAFSRPYEGFIKEFTATEIGRQLTLNFLFPFIIIAISTGYMRLLGDHLGMYDPATGTGLRTVLFIVLMTWILYFNAKELNARIAAQRLTQDALKQKEKEIRRDEVALRFLIDLSVATQNLTDPNEIMAVTARRLGEHLGADRCAYAQVEDESVFVITGDYLKDVPSIVGRWPVAAFGSECARMMHANQPYVVDDADADPRISPKDLEAYRATTIRAVICVPLHKDKKFTAAMAVHQRNSRTWTAEEIELVGLVVGRCWESLERAKIIYSLEQSEQRQKEYARELEKINRSLEESTLILEDRVAQRTKLLEEQAHRLRQLAVELTEVEQKERRRLAEVLHDHLQQFLVAAKMRLDVVERKFAGVDKKGLLEARSYIDQAVEASRHLTAELRPPVLYEGGLSAGLRYLGQKMKEQHKLGVHLSVTGDVEPGSDLMKVMIYQCVQELLFNSVKYANVAECFVTVTRLENQMIQVVVKDKGLGFNMADIGSNEKRGFGLFSIRERVKALGGEFKISSMPGQGSVFVMIVPDKVEEPGAEGTRDAPAKKIFSRDRRQSEGIVVLVADDHPIIRQSIASLLQSQAFIKEVIEAKNGEEAVQKAEATDPDIILMDINMPIMNGIEATQILCKRNSRSKVIGLSVQPESEIAQTMKDVGAVAYFNKGDDTGSLIETIKRFASEQASS